MDLQSKKTNDSNHKVGSAIIVPIIVDDNIIGVIQIFSSKMNAYTKEQLSFIEALMQPIGLAINNAILYQNAQNEIKERKLAETRISHSLHEKELLLKEIHHRVKNNLQVMSSLIKLQSHYIKDEKMLEMMKETGSRIQSMAIVHTKLYNTKDYDHIDFNEYVRSLAENFATSYGFRMKNIKINIDILNILLNIDTAIPCGLVINELVSNSVKYAFPDNRSGEIFISLSKKDNRKFILTVRDTGIGAPQNKDIGKSDTLGIQLVTLLSKQMNGHLQIINEKGKGLEFRITFEEAIYKARS
jgi:two-component sensor histidine kinase